MKTNLIGRLRNSTLKPNHGLHPLFEAIANAIHAIQATKAAGRITVRINRAAEQPDIQGIGPISFAKIEGFSIADTGEGFTAANFESFETMDSRAKVALGGKGVGRLIWLLAFERAVIASTFREGEALRTRRFEFETSDEGIVNHTVADAAPDAVTGTTVELVGFKDPYSQRVPKAATVIARRIIDCFLSYFALEMIPRITVIDSQTSEAIDLSDLFRSEVVGKIESQEFLARGETLKVTHLRIAADAELEHRINFCAHHRTVQNESLREAVPNLTPAVEGDEGRPFVYCGYISGDFLDRSVNQDRTAFNIPDEDLFHDSQQPTWPEIVQGGLSQTVGYLAPFTAPIRERKNEYVVTYVQTRAPRYRHVLKHRPQVLDKIPATAGDTRIDLELYRAQQDYQRELRQRYEVLLKENDPKAIEEDTYEQAFQIFIQEWNEAGQAALAEHVMLRSATLRFLDSRRAVQQSGKHLLEEAIHRVVFPLHNTSDDLPPEKMNLWIIDERLSYHHYLASDTPLSEMTAAVEVDSEDRPDIAIFNLRSAFVDSMTQFQSVVLIEFKKPGRNDYKEDSNPFNQTFKYVRLIRSGKAKDRRGNYISVRENTPFYAHVIAELTPTLRTQIQNYGFTPTPDGEGYFHFNGQLGVWIDVMSFDKLIDDAKRRNQVFFEKLGVAPFPV
jgi:hypothetical protein